MSSHPLNGEHFPKSHRLLRRPEFLRVQRQGRRVHQDLLIAAWAAGDASHARVGLTVSRKVGNAVVRNRVKRRLREGLRRRDGRGRQLLERLSGLEVVFIARSTTSGATTAELHSDLEAAVRRIERAARVQEA